MYQYNCIFLWASRDEKQLFSTPVRRDFLSESFASPFQFVAENTQKNLPLALRAREKFWARSTRGQVYRETSTIGEQACG